MTDDDVNAVDRSELETLRNEQAAAFGRLEGKLDAYIASHSTTHSGEQAAFSAHLIDAAQRNVRTETLPALESRVDVLEDWRIEVRTLGTFIRLTFGSSLIAAVAAIAAIAKAVGAF